MLDVGYRLEATSSKCEESQETGLNRLGEDGVSPYSEEKVPMRAIKEGISQHPNHPLSSSVSSYCASESPRRKEPGSESRGGAASGG